MSSMSARRAGIVSIAKCPVGMSCTVQPADRSRPASATMGVAGAQPVALLVGGVLLGAWWLRAGRR
jgi:hypothetical protein